MVDDADRVARVLYNEYLQNESMEEYKALETSVLLDMLAQQTAEYTRMLGEYNRDPVFYEFEKSLHLLQLEINARSFKDTTISKPDIDFTTDVS